MHGGHGGHGQGQQARAPMPEPPQLAPVRGPLRRSGRGGFYVGLIALALAIVGGTGAWYWWSLNKPGTIQVAVVPEDATVLIDNVKVGEHSPTTIEKGPGPYMLSVTHDGYVRNDQNFELRAGQTLKLAVTLEASPDTGFELTSEPSGGLVWLDGAPINGANGQARTDFRAYRIAAGHHVIEIKGESKFKPWRQEVEIEPGTIKKIHALLLPAGAAGASAVAKVEPKPEPKPEPTVVAKAEPKPEPRPEAKTPAGGEHHVTLPSASQSSSGAGATGGEATTRVTSSGRRRKVAREPAVEPSGDDDKDTESAKTEAAAEGGDCSITLGSRPWSEVWIDGKNTNKHTPFADYKISCGKHKISFKRPDLQIDHAETISVRQGQKFKQSFTLETENEP